MFMDAIEFCKEEVVLKQIGKFMYEIEVTSKDTGKVIFKRSFYLSEPISCLAPSLSKDGMLFVVADNEVFKSTENPVIRSSGELDNAQKIIIPYDEFCEKEYIYKFKEVEDGKSDKSLTTLNSRASIFDSCFNEVLDNFMVSIDSVIQEYAPGNKETHLSKTEKLDLYKEIKQRYSNDSLQAVFINQGESFFQVNKKTYFIIN